MKINYKGNSDNIQLAVEDANDILYSEKFYELISSYSKFECTDNLTPNKIADIIRNSELEVEVKLYKPRYKWSKVLGYFVKSRPTNVFLNKRKLNRESSSLTNTIIHEYVHAVDYDSDNGKIRFGHYKCSSLNYSAPYIIGNIAELMIDGYEVEDIEQSMAKFDVHDFHQCYEDYSTKLDEEELIFEEYRIY